MPEALHVSATTEEGVAELQKLTDWAVRLTEERRPLIEKRRAQSKARKASGTARTEEEILLRSAGNIGSGVGLEWIRMGRRHVSEKLEASAAELNCSFDHFGLTLGSVINGIDLAEGELSQAHVELIRATLNERKVIVLREQRISPGEQTAFAERFGDIDGFPFAPHVRGHKSVVRIAQGDQAVPSINAWHTDVTWMKKPSAYSMMHMVELPPIEGLGDTMWSDSHAVYLSLPAHVKEKINGATTTHDWREFRAAQRKIGISEESLAALEVDVPFGVTHPVVRTHPETGKQALYLHPGFIRHDSFVGPDGVPYDKEESKEFLSYLLQQHNRPETQCRWSYQLHDLVMWDNAAVQHYAVSDYFPYRRAANRIQVSGTVPYYIPDADAKL